VGTWLIDPLKNTNENAQTTVRVNNELGEWFNVAVVSPYISSHTLKEL